MTSTNCWSISTSSRQRCSSVPMSTIRARFSLTAKRSMTSCTSKSRLHSRKQARELMTGGILRNNLLQSSPRSSAFMRSPNGLLSCIIQSFLPRLSRACRRIGSGKGSPGTGSTTRRPPKQLGERSESMQRRPSWSQHLLWSLATMRTLQVSI